MPQASPTMTVTVPLPAQSGQSLPARRPLPPQRGHGPSALCGVPGRVSSPGCTGEGSAGAQEAEEVVGMAVAGQPRCPMPAPPGIPFAAAGP